MRKLRPKRSASSVPSFLPNDRPRPLGRFLVDDGAISTEDLLHGLDLQRHVDAPLGEILIAEGLAQPDDVLLALSEQHRTRIVDLEKSPPNADLSRLIPVDLCFRYSAVAWRETAGTVQIATSRPHEFAALCTALGDRVQNPVPVIAPEGQIKTQISRLYGAELAQKAATRVPAAQSCRTWDIAGRQRRLWAVAILALLAAALIAAPLWTITAATLWAFVTLLMTTALKAAALIAELLRTDKSMPAAPMRTDAFPLPSVSVLVPLLREKEIAGALIRRLSRLTYPKSMLQVVLVLEAEDTVTRDTIARTALPPWISVVEVPAANQLTTKPRALNYALDFCRGSIIGVWDAEDAPEPDQIERVVARFQTAPANVACLQGVLDYYNDTANWLSRCFTIEYASWWRVLLPGVSRLGLVLPLGGTTLFFRRDALEKLRGWDAHNVTEDADLGVRLARAGYVTELLSTATHEEANCRLWPWVRQRSRWLKGFLITWCVHMRDPARLWRDLGAWRFFGVQAMLLATFSQFACAPLLWAFWLTLVGMPHPVAATLGAPAVWTMVVVFVLAEFLNLVIAGFAVRGAAHRHLMRWVLTTPFYYPLGALAAFKALYEFVVSPFYWDKTTHGVTPAPETMAAHGGELRGIATKASGARDGTSKEAMAAE